MFQAEKNVMNHFHKYSKSISHNKKFIFISSNVSNYLYDLVNDMQMIILFLLFYKNCLFMLFYKEQTIRLP